MMIELPATRRRILLAYAVSQFASIQEAMWRLANQGDVDARQQAQLLTSWLDVSAGEWAAELGSYVDGPQAVDGMVTSARAYLTMHQRELDRLLEGVSDDNSGNGS